MAERYVLDASALLSLLQGEEGAERVEAVLGRSVISSVNYSEVVAKIVERGGTVEFAAAVLDPLHLDTVDFDRPQAIEAGRLRAATRRAGLSFGDGACLALAAVQGLPVMTADRAWAELPLAGLRIELLR